MKTPEFTLEETRRPLAVLTGPADGPSPRRRRDLAGRPDTWCAEIEWRCALLRERPRTAEALTVRPDRVLSATGETKDERERR